MQHSWVLIVDYGSQYTQLIARKIREQKVYCEIHPCTVKTSEIKKRAPQAIVLSGGPSSVFEKNAPLLDPALLELGIPVLGICYGMQLICHMGGGRVERGSQGEYGPAKLQVKRKLGLFQSLEENALLDVWMSHGDRVEEIPPGFEILGSTHGCPTAAIADFKRNIFAVQFHLEVQHTPQGGSMLSTFLFDIAGCKPDWTPASFIEETLEQIRTKVGKGAAVCGLSGGVDSTVAALLVAKAIGKRLTCIFVDNGLLRKDEARSVMDAFEAHRELTVVHVDASKRFLSELAGVTDPETKRKIIGKVFIDVFDEEAAKLKDVSWLVQGTLYPDVIESVSFKGPSVVIKSHHNVGGLPERMKLKLIEPLRELFKDEVRRVGEALGAAPALLGRHPFPGPGLAIRCLGEITQEKLAILRQADAIFMEEIRNAHLYDVIWQAFCVILPVRSVGVMGDERTYDYVVGLRAVESRDGMTADWSRIPYDVLAKTSSRITNEVRGCNRVVYDISSKPPSTIEWE